jgi:hypothetical protein
VVNFSLIFIILEIIPTAFWNGTTNICIWRGFILPLIFSHHCPTTGIFAFCRCPGCGMTHAISAFVHGNFAAAYEYNRLVYIVVAVMLIILIKNILTLIRHKSGLISI